MSSIRRPEHKAPPDVFYNEEEARKYTSNSRMIEIQEKLSERAIELLLLPDEPCMVLDLGCGSGLSGSCLQDQGHWWVGVDISKAMLDVAKERDDIEGDLILGDLGDGLPFRAGTFDGAISISALQWLCNADKTYHKPQKRLYTFFSTLYACLKRGSRAIFQFYPENASQIEMITSQSMKAGFGGGLVVDYPNSTKAKKYFLVLNTGNVPQALPKALGTESEHSQSQVRHERTRDRVIGGKNRKPLKKSRDWIMEKKERRRNKGKETRYDSKYTGRSRRRL